MPASSALGESIAGALLLAALVEAQDARADGLDARLLLAKLTESGSLSSDEAALLHLAVAVEAPHLLTEAELAALLDPDTLVRLGLSPEFVGDLLDDGTEEALRRLKEAFGPKLKAAVANAERKLFADDSHFHKASTQSDATAGGESSGTAAAAAAGTADASMSPLALLLGAAGIGAIGVAVGGGGGGDGNAPASLNNAPTASNDTVTTAEDTAVTFDVRTNDSDPDGNPLSVTAINGTAITTAAPVTIANVGTVALNAAGTLTFTPVANYNGTPSFTYTLSDGRGGTATGTVNLTVTAVNDAPVNSVPTAAVAATAGVGIAVGGISVADADGGNLTTTLSLGTGQGTLAVAAVAGGATITGSGTAAVTISGTIAQVNASLGAVTFTSAAGFSGNATLTVSTSDGTLTDVDTRTITVARVQSGVVSDGYIAGGTVFIDVNGNGVRDPDEPQTTTNSKGSYSFASNAIGPIVAIGGTNTDTGLPNLVKLTAPVGATVVNPLTTIVQSLVATGVPAAQATMQVAVALGLPATTNLASYDILAQPAGDPVALAAQKVATQIVTLLNTAREAAGSANAAAVETAVIAKLASAVTAAVSGNGGSNGNSGAMLDLGSTATLTSVLSNIEGIAPTAVMKTVAKAAAINQMIATATDLGAITTTQVATSQPNVNLAPATTADVVTVAEDGTVTIDVLENDLDADGNPLIVIAVEGVAIDLDTDVVIDGVGTVSLNADGTLSFRPIANFNGTQSFDYTISDGQGGTNTGTVNLTVTAVNDAPVAVADSVAATEDTAVTFDVRSNDSDADGNPLSVAAINGTPISTTSPVVVAGVGTIVLNASGTLTFTPVANVNGLKSFAYTLSDGQGGTASGTVNLNIAAVDEPASLTIRANELGFVIDNADDIAASGVEELDVDGPGTIGALTLTDGQASILIDAGLNLADEDVVTVAVATQLSTSLQSLQALGVDSIAVSSSIAALDVAAGSLAGLVASELPQLDEARTDASLDVTLDVAAGSNLFAGVTDSPTLIAALGAAGIDHLDIGGDGLLGSTHISDAEAGALIAAGIDFEDDDNITVVTAGTQLQHDARRSPNARRRCGFGALGRRRTHRRGRRRSRSAARGRRTAAVRCRPVRRRARCDAQPPGGRSARPQRIAVPGAGRRPRRRGRRSSRHRRRRLRRRVRAL